jgi:rRNA maturation protein Nop10
MNVHCPHCGADYDAPVTEGMLGLVDRCAQCGRTGLRAVLPKGSPEAGPDPPAQGPDDRGR